MDRIPAEWTGFCRMDRKPVETQFRGMDRALNYPIGAQSMKTYVGAYFSSEKSSLPIGWAPACAGVAMPIPNKCASMGLVHNPKEQILSAATKSLKTQQL